ncbi:MAG: tRNA (guanosine(37)-N1)-methyltransferase TrmD [Pseudomonadota bacterium]
MRFDVITIFPRWFEALEVTKIWSRAQENGLVDFRVHDLRDFAEGPHRTVDDVPFGGGPGMVLKVEPLVKAVESVEAMPGRKILCTTPQGRPLTQAWAEELSRLPQLVIIAGRYEGVDERFVEGWVDETFSIGDYVLSGGELPAMVLVETVGRLIPGVVGDAESVASDSFTSGRLKFPQYTRPAVFRDREVPGVLRSGNHAQIEKWRMEKSVERTRAKRPDLLEESKMTRSSSHERTRNYR